jgi:F-type H+-transporting ATPase subunit delta
MAEISTIARPYAEALFRVAKQGDLSAWANSVAEMSAVAANADMQAVIANPKLSDTQIYGVFVAGIKTELTAPGQNFVRMLIENGRLAAMPEIAAQFQALKNAQEGTAEAVITSAFPMSEAQVSDLLAVLEKKFKAKLKPAVTVDASLIGGVRVVVGDQVLDTSVRTRLEQMRAALVA